MATFLALWPGRELGRLGLAHCFGAQQLPDPGSKCPMAGLGEAGVALSTVAPPRQPPSLLSAGHRHLRGSPRPSRSVPETDSTGHGEPCPSCKVVSSSAHPGHWGLEVQGRMDSALWRALCQRGPKTAFFSSESYKLRQNDSFILFDFFRTQMGRGAARRPSEW